MKNFLKSFWAKRRIEILAVSVGIDNSYFENWKVGLLA